MTRESPVCIGCGKKPTEIAEYVEAAEHEDMTPDSYVRSEEGTYNRESNRFACTKCYVELGMPATPQGWIAP